MDLVQMQYFKTVVHMGSVSKAAATLFVTQSTLSKSITALERSLGTRLFDRVGNGLQINEAGRLFLDYAERILELSSEAEQSVKYADDLNSGSVVYSVPSGGTLTDIEAEFLDRYPNVHLKQRMLNAEQALSALQNREIDFAFSFQPIRAQGIQWLPIREVGFVAIMSAGHALAAQKELPLSALKYERFFVNNVNTDNSQFLTTLCKQAGFVPNVIYEGDDLLLSVRFMSERQCVSVSPAMNMCGDLHTLFYNTDSDVRKKVTQVPIIDPPATLEFGVARMQGHYLNGTAKEFYRHVVRCCCEDAGEHIQESAAPPEAAEPDP